MSTPIQIDGYKILDSIGAGGMGELFRAEKLENGRIVAIKIIHYHLSSDAQIVARFEREANCLAKLDHQSIVGIVERGRTAKGQYFLVMEFVEGQNLRKWIAAKTFTVTECVRVVQLIAYSLKYAHSQNVLHRDIKPENILVNKDDKGELKVKILDFGLAASLERSADEPELTAAGAVIGTPFYMSPEQRFDPRKVDARTDIFALGVLFYELLTGGPPRGAYRLPSEVNIHAAPALDAIIDKMMATGPQHRYQSAQEVLDVLAGVIKSGVTRTPEEVEAAKAKLAQSSGGGSKKPAKPLPATGSAARPAGTPITPPPSGASSARAIARPASNHGSADQMVPVFSSLPSTSLQSTLTVGGRCRPGAHVHVKVGGKEYPTVTGQQGHFSVMVDLQEGDNILVAWSEVEGVRSPEAPAQHVRFTPGGTRVSTRSPGAEEQRYGTIVHPGNAPSPAVQHARDDRHRLENPVSKSDPNWTPSAPQVYGVTDQRGEDEPEEGGSRRGLKLAFAILVGVAVAVAAFMLKGR